MIKHVEDYTNMFNDHWDYPHGDVITNKIRNQPKQSRTNYVNKESTKHLFVMIIYIHIMKQNLLIG